MATEKDLNELQYRVQCAVAGIPYLPPAQRAVAATLAEALTRGTLPPVRATLPTRIAEAVQRTPASPTPPDDDTDFHARLTRAVTR